TQVGQGTSNQTFTFIFSQQVNTADINFSNTTSMYYTTNVTTSPTPVTALSGTQGFDSTDTILSISGTNLVPGQTITFSFTSSILDTLGVALTPNTCNYSTSIHRHPAEKARLPHAAAGSGPIGGSN
ncbi:MAG TPA: hypothetical protein VEJ41_09730, partial [Candidatus Acidoferrales bacterium]|nr:hypothetical protein [Candidatus Acidoferrales bacterium]